MEWVDQTTSDAEIIGRRWLPLDFDPHRLSGIPATEEEKQASIMLAETAEELLRRAGWPYPAIMESGNGCYRLFRIDLPNDTETTDLLRRVLLGIASLLGTQEQESGPYATLDLTMFNAARIIRLPGTMNRKGDDTSTRPHRRTVLYPPLDECPIDVVSLDLLQAVAALAPEPARQPARQTTATAGSNGHVPPRLDVARWLADRHIEHRTKDRPDGRGYLVPCPFGPHGGSGESAVWQADSGLLTYECKHASCGGRQWADFRDAIGKPEAHHYDPPLTKNGSKARPATPTYYTPGQRVRLRDRGNIGYVETDNQGPTVDVRTTNPTDGNTRVKSYPREEVEPLDGDGSEPSKPLPAIRDAYELCQNDIPLPAELVVGLLHQASKLSIGGASKGFKTWTLDYLCLAVAYGLDFLGLPTRQSKVLLIDLELQEAFSRRRLVTLEHARGIQREPGRLDVWNLRGYATSYREIFPRVIERIRDGGYGLLTLDPIYKLYGSDTDENSARDVAALMNAIEALAVETGAAVAFGSHFSKGNQAGKDAIDRVSGSGVFARDPDSLLNLTAHEQPDCYTVNVTLRNFPPMEPFVVRWEFPLFVRDDGLDPAALKPAKQANRQQDMQKAREQQLEQDRKLVVKSMLKYPNGETATVIRTGTGISGTRFNPALASLIADNTAVLAGQIRKENGKSYDAYRLSNGGDES